MADGGGDSGMGADSGAAVGGNDSASAMDLGENSFVFDVAMGDGYMSGANQFDASEMALGVNFYGGLASANYTSSVDDSGLFVYNTSTGALEWDTSGSGSLMGDSHAVVASTASYFLLSASDGLVIDI